MDIDFYKIAQNYFQGTITEEDEKLLSGFLQESEHNRVLFRQWSDEWSQVAKEQASANTQAAWEQIVKSGKMGGQKPARKRMYAYWAAAAVALLLIGCALWLFIPKSANEPFLAQTGKHEQKTVTLPDGTRVTLNSESTLSHSDDFGKRDRLVSFEGEGVFEVQKDAKKPFVIQVGDYSVTVLGTHFNLSAYSQDDAYTVALISGSVKVKYQQDSVVLQPDEQVRFDRQTATFTKETIQGENADAWTHGRLDFNNIPLRDLAHKLERIYDVRIAFDDPQLAQEQVYISISTEEPFQNVCSALEALMPIDIHEQNGTYLISAQ